MPAGYAAALRQASRRPRIAVEGARDPVLTPAIGAGIGRMDLFAEVKALVLGGDRRGWRRRGGCPQGLDLAARHGRAAARPGARRHGDQRRDGAGAPGAAWPPRDIAAALAERLGGAPGRRRGRGGGAGLSEPAARPGALVRRSIPQALAAGRGLRPLASSGAGRRVNVEFVSANPTGPMHVGHVRGAVFGDALAGLLAFAGFEVTREYYINDGGAQVDVLARSAYERYREACGLEPAIAEGLYPGDYLIPVGEALKARFGDAPARPARGGLAGRGARVRHRGDDGDDPRGPGAARRPDGPLLLREVALRHRPDRGGAGGAATRKGLLYEGVLEPPEGQAARRTGSRASRRCSARPPTATTSTGR